MTKKKTEQATKSGLSNAARFTVALLSGVIFCCALGIWAISKTSANNAPMSPSPNKGVGFESGMKDRFRGMRQLICDIVPGGKTVLLKGQYTEYKGTAAVRQEIPGGALNRQYRL